MRLWTCLVAVLMSTLPHAAEAQGYPSRPLKLITADGPGSASDARARQLAAHMGEGLGQPVIVENRPGGSMTIAAAEAAAAAPDGYTLFMGNSLTHSINPWTFKTLAYRPEDFVPVSLVAAGPLVLFVNASVPAGNVQELLQIGRSQPGKLNYSALGVGSPGHLVMEQIRAAHGAQFHFVPYKSTGQYINDLLGGHLQVGLNYWSVIAPHVKSGKLRALAVEGANRLEVAPDIPTFAEAGVKIVEGKSWQGIMVPAGTAPAIVARLHRELVRVLALPEVRRGILDSGADLGGNTPEEFAAYIRADRERWKKVVSTAGIEPK